MERKTLGKGGDWGEGGAGVAAAPEEGQKDSVLGGWKVLLFSHLQWLRGFLWHSEVWAEILLKGGNNWLHRNGGAVNLWCRWKCQTSKSVFFFSEYDLALCILHQLCRKHSNGLIHKESLIEVLAEGNTIRPYALLGPIVYFWPSCFWTRTAVKLRALFSLSLSGRRHNSCELPRKQFCLLLSPFPGSFLLYVLTSHI